MKHLVEHRILSSFKEWFDHTLLSEGEAFFNITSGTFYQMPNVLGQTCYSSPHLQWVSDVSISGANIPLASGIGVNYIDYENGRVLGSSPSGQVSYSVKEVNVYTTSKSDQELIFSTKFNTRADPYLNTPSTGAQANSVTVPCSILKCDSVRSAEMQIGGGLIEKKMQYSAIIITDSEFLLHGVGNLFADKQNTSFPILSVTPYNKYGDYKSTPFNYNQIKSGDYTMYDIVRIKSANFVTVQHDSISKIHPNLYFGKVVFDLSFYKGINR